MKSMLWTLSPPGVLSWNPENSPGPKLPLLLTGPRKWGNWGCRVGGQTENEQMLSTSNSKMYQKKKKKMAGENSKGLERCVNTLWRKANILLKNIYTHIHTNTHTQRYTMFMEKKIWVYTLIFPKFTHKISTNAIKMPTRFLIKLLNLILKFAQEGKSARIG
jgi:hypothetical protein